eukprot:jgi/Mesvir1/13695/Mv02128-RA.1
MAAKHPMEDFYRDCLRFGTLRHFRHFSLYLRGREELLVNLHANPSAARAPGFSMMSTVGGLPPASPATSDVGEDTGSDIVFLIGAYARYKWPYVWLRTCPRWLESAPGGKLEKDTPLYLNTTKSWKANGYRVWDILEELVVMNVFPSATNPFQVDFASLEATPGLEQALMAGALAHFLQELLTPNLSYAAHSTLFPIIASWAVKGASVRVDSGSVMGRKWSIR